MALGKNVRRLREWRRETRPDIARAIGLEDDQAIYALESRDSSRSALAVPLARHFGVELEALLASDIAGLSDSQLEALLARGRSPTQAPLPFGDQKRERDENTEPGPPILGRRYPVISWVQAGMWSELCENFEAAEDTEWRVTTVDLGPCGFVLRVKGKSMTAGGDAPYSFPEGTYLFVSPDAEALPGKFVIARHNGNEAMFKRLTTVDGELYLEALNPDWPNQYIKLAPGDEIIGVVMTAQQNLP